MRKLLFGILTGILLCGPAIAADQIRIAAFGDSLVHGYGLPPGDGFVPAMQRWLEAQGQAVQMINAGVSGDTTAGGAARIDWTLSDGIEGLIVVLGGNDVLRAQDPGLARANIDLILGRAEASGVAVLLVGIPAPGNFGPDYRQRFEAIYPELAAAHGAQLYPDFFAALADYSKDPARLREVMQPDGIHPNAAGIALIVADMGPYVAKLIDRITAD